MANSPCPIKGTRPLLAPDRASQDAVAIAKSAGFSYVAIVAAAGDRVRA
jgi:hypothetical protein